MNEGYYYVGKHHQDGLLPRKLKKIYISYNNHKEQRNIRRDPVFPVSIKSVYIR